jgi:uncharacterized protein YebE (UPF0316 family)
LFVLPLLICLAETVVVTLDTVRTIFIARGMKGLATLIGLLEVCIWLFAIKLVMQNLTNLGFMASYATGFALGTYLGIRIEEYLALGKQGIRIITRRDATELINSLRAKNYGVTMIDAEGSAGIVHVLFTIVDRKQTREVIGTIQQFDPTTFYVIEDVRSVAKGVFPMSGTGFAWREDWKPSRQPQIEKGDAKTTSDVRTAA